MAKEINQNGGSPTSDLNSEFRGYSLEELRYQRALLLLKREFLKEKAMNTIDDAKKRVPVLNGKSPLSNISPSGIMGRVVKGLNYADYLMLGFAVFNAGKKVFSLFRKRKK